MENKSNDNFDQPNKTEPYASSPIFSNETIVDTGPKKHSGIGIASFVIALVSIVLLIIAFAAGSSVTDQIGNSDIIFPDPATESAAFQAAVEDLGPEVIASLTLAIFGIFGACALAFIGLILAIVGAVSSKRRRLFGIIGILLNIGAFVGGIALFFVGIASIAAVATIAA